jgi:Sulfotransferase family
MPPRLHILVVNGRKVRQPVFVIGAPHSGADLLGRALKRSPGFHLTIGQDAVQSVVYAFARSPSIQRGRSEAAATVLRDAFAQAWQVTAGCCLSCSPVCREAGGVNGASCCVAARDIARYGDASPDLMYCADGLVDAFPDAKLIQIIRDGRDVVAAMLGDPQATSWFRPGMANVEAEFPNPFYGIDSEPDKAAWPGLTVAGKAAMRWRGSVRMMARLRTTMSADQLTTVRYEDMIRHPGPTGAGIAGFVGGTVAPIPVRQVRREPPGALEPGAGRKLLGPAQLAEIERVAGSELLRTGYGTLASA